MKAGVAGSTLVAIREIVAHTPRARILICGSLYLAGGILRENG
jgi:dihydrofolate synthase/folylpolyglutamate synthase